jgi:hypothetical protein
VNAGSSCGRLVRWRTGEPWIVRGLIGEVELRLDVIDAAVPLPAVYMNLCFRYRMREVVRSSFHREEDAPLPS